MRLIVMTVAFAFVMGVTTISQEQSGQAIGTASNQATLLTTTIIGFLSLLATQGFAMWRESRNRKWDQQDRQAAREELLQRSERQRLEVIDTAVQLAKVSNANRAHMSAEINRNTTLTEEVGTKADAAYHAANDFTNRLETLRRELLEARGQLEHVEDVSVDTNVTVKEIKKDGRP